MNKKLFLDELHRLLSDLPPEERNQAIKYYEESLELCKQHGKASTDLMKLYNKKRQEAAEAKDDEKVKEYMDKVQNLMQMSKDMIRGNA